ncbi:MAG: phospholipase A [Pseudomonadales bacterium]
MLSAPQSVRVRALAATWLTLTAVLASAGAHAADQSACLLRALSEAADAMTVGELKALCEPPFVTMESTPVKPSARTASSRRPVYERGALEERIRNEALLRDRPWVMTPHQPNYFLATYFSNPYQAPFAGPAVGNRPLNEQEAKFQVSFKAPIWRRMFNRNLDVYVAYSATSWWQLGNNDLSNPFRETDYEPELFISSYTDIDLLGLRFAGWTLGIDHESNGRTEPLSRSWNRILGRTSLQVLDDLTVQLRAWYRLPEHKKDDDNPGMHRYYGYGDLRAIWTPNKNTFTVMGRPGTDKGAFEVTWSYPISNVFRVYAQYYNGYGESLIDYDRDIERFGIGVALNDFLMRQ